MISYMFVNVPRGRGITVIRRLNNDRRIRQLRPTLRLVMGEHVRHFERIFCSNLKSDRGDSPMMFVASAFA